MDNVKRDVLIEARDLTKHFISKGNALGTKKLVVKAVNGLTFKIMNGETLGLVGESGCGKSTTGRTILRLIEKTDGQVLFNGKEIFDLDKKEMHKLRQKMQIIFQDPYSSLSPRLPIGEIIGEAVKEHNLVPKNEYSDYVDQIMENCGLQPYHKSRYPHEFSGGQRQRICIARALALNPEFIVCDEPVSALDVSIQAQILNLMQDLQEERNLTYLFITHNMSVVKHISDRILVMYLGTVVELADAQEMFRNRLHPYTKALLAAVPIPALREKQPRKLLKGEISSPIDPKPGCRFASRCPYATELCRTQSPGLEEVLPGHYVSCHRVREINQL